MYSAIIPAYNRPVLVKDAIESVFRQSMPPSEIIVIDDASDIPLSDVLRPYFPRVKLIRNDINMGVSASRNIAVKSACTKFVAFLDSDDVWLPHKMERQMEFMLSGGFPASHTDEFWYRCTRWVNQGKQHTRYGGKILCKILDKCRISPSSLVLERSLFESLGGYDESLRVCEDYELSLRLAAVAEIGYLEDRAIIKRNIAENSLSNGIEYIESVRLGILERFAAGYDGAEKECIKQELERKRGIVKK
jgi:glycosyltransferase involved in cell wall biosynthesis